jgi:hypothetical protein
MKTIPLFAILLALATPACVVSDYSGYGGGYSGSYTGYGSTPVYRSYSSSPYYGSVRPAYYSGSYYGGGYGRYSAYDRYRGDECYDDHRHYSSSDKKKSSSSSRDIRITDYNESRKRRELPTGYHSPEWWKSRGYSLEKNTYKNRDGDVKGKKSSSSSKKKK